MIQLPKAEADFTLCGGGQGADCCIYLVAGPDGVECGREDPALKRAVEAKRPTMTAQRMPKGPFPSCQEEGRR